SGTLNVGTATLSRNVAGGGGRGGHGASTNGATDGSSGSDGGFGGGVFSEGGAISIINSTIVGNTPGDGGIGGTGGNSTSGGRGANGGHGGNSGDGGGISTLFDTGGDSVRSTTVVGNALGSPGLGGPGGNGAGGPGSRGGSGVSGSGAGIADYLSSISLRNTLVASNVGDNCAGSFANKQHNLSFPDATCPGINRDPKLGALRNNGGPTKTIAPGHAGAAIDRVPASGAGCPLTDQRGVGRPGGHACDIGAYEVASPTVGPAHVSGLGNHQAMVSLNVTANQTDATVYLEYGTSTRYAKM